MISGLLRIAVIRVRSGIPSGLGTFLSPAFLVAASTSSVVSAELVHSLWHRSSQQRIAISAKRGLPLFCATKEGK